jgi:hypothetical protein
MLLTSTGRKLVGVPYICINRPVSTSLGMSEWQHHTQDFLMGVTANYGNPVVSEI